MNSNPANLSQDVIDALPTAVQAQIPHYYDTKQPKIYATLSVCLVIAYVALGIRLYARRATKQAFGLDDLFALLAVLFTTISVSLVGHLTKLGLGRHEIVIVVEHIEDFDALNHTIVASTAMYLPIIFCIKASALLLYCRIFPNRRFHIICYVLLAFTALYALASIFLLTIPCLPPYPPTLEEPVAQLKCPNLFLGILLLAILVTNVLLDAIIICLPLPLIWRLQTNIWKKLQLTFVFTLGSFIFAISILRVVAIFQLAEMDDNWGSTDVQLWSIAESAVAILTVSLPVMQPVLRQAIYRKDGTSRITKSGGSSNQNQNKLTDGSHGRNIALLTFGRSGKKGPSRRNPQGLTELTTIASETLVDTRFNESGTRLVTETRGSHENTGYVDSWQRH